MRISFSRSYMILQFILYDLLTGNVFASQCVEPYNYGGQQIVIISSNTLQDCTTGVVLDPTEYAQWLNTSNIWTIPDVQALRDIWMAGFSIPVIIWLVTYAYASVINFATTDHK